MTVKTEPIMDYDGLADDVAELVTELVSRLDRRNADDRRARNRFAFLLNLNGLSYAEIARAFQMSASSVAAQVRSARDDEQRDEPQAVNDQARLAVMWADVCTANLEGADQS